MRKDAWSAVGLLTMVVFAFGSVKGDGQQGGTTSSNTFRRGEQAVLDMDGHPEVWLAVDEKADHELTAFSTQRNEGAVKQLMASGRVLVCSRGTKVAVVDPGIMTTTVRVMDGKHVGQTGVVANEFLHK